METYQTSVQKLSNLFQELSNKPVKFKKFDRTYMERIVQLVASEKAHKHSVLKTLGNIENNVTIYVKPVYYNAIRGLLQNANFHKTLFMEQDADVFKNPELNFSFEFRLIQVKEYFDRNQLNELVEAFCNNPNSYKDLIQYINEQSM